MSARPSVAEIFLVALRLGCTSFGGPVAHLAYFRKEYVERRGWLDEARYADLVALGQFLPGPASSQIGFGVGYLQRGLPGGLAAWLGFTLPSAVLMTAFAYGVAALGDLRSAGWLHGLKAAAVAVVAQAVWQMWRNLAPDVPRSLFVLLAALAVWRLPSATTPVLALAAGALAGGWWFRPGAIANAAASPAGNRSTGAILLVGFFALLVALPALARLTPLPAALAADKFFRSGALVFGGGHVVLPLLDREFVTPGWISADRFLAGYGAAQAMPGPLFTFAAYLGAAMTAPALAPLAAAGAIVAIFLPGLLLMAGTLPFWETLRARPGAQGAMRGANAAVVGVLLAALVDPVGTAGITDGRSAAIALGAFAALQFARLPAWAVVGLAAAAGAIGA